MTFGTLFFLQAAKEVENFRDQQTREANQLMKNNAQKMYQELVNKGTVESFSKTTLAKGSTSVKQPPAGIIPVCVLDLLRTFPQFFCLVCLLNDHVKTRSIIFHLHLHLHLLINNAFASSQYKLNKLQITISEIQSTCDNVQ